MVHELMVALTVTDDDAYARYRDEMAPLLAAHGGGFRFDFTIDRVLRSASEHPINRVFTIHFSDRAAMDRFFAHPDYRAIKARWFERAVAGTTIVGAWDR